MENKNTKDKNLTWSFKGMYSSPKDPRIEKDMKNYEAFCASFEKKYKNSVSKFSDPKFLLKALNDYVKIYDYKKPDIFLFLFRAINSSDNFSQALEKKMEARQKNASNKILFFENSISKISLKEQKNILANAKLSAYKQFLKRLFKTGKYSLADSEEKIINLLASPSYTFWVEGGVKKRNSEIIKFEGESMPLSKANNILKDLPTEKRRSLYKEIVKVLERNVDYSENEINAVYTFKKIDDELRGHKTPYESTLISYDTEEKTLQNLLKGVKDGFKYAKDFYSTKKDLLKLPYLKYCDRAVSPGKIKKKFTWQESIEILRKSFGEMDKEFLDILNKMLEDGRVDVFPRVNKEGGGFCVSTVNQPTHIMLNHVNSFYSLMTFAHEMGHAIHGELSRKQPFLYQGHSTTVAETASTFFERVVFDEVFKSLDEEDKKIALHDQLQDDINTIFRQVVFFMYELDIHELVRKEGFVSKDILCERMNYYTSLYAGPSMKLEKEDGLFFVDCPHLRFYFYVYSYAYGQIVSKALYEEYKKDNGYVKNIKKFLSAGCSMSPEEIFKSAGIDISKPDFFKKGIDGFAKDLKEFKKMLKR